MEEILTLVYMLLIADTCVNRRLTVVCANIFQLDAEYLNVEQPFRKYKASINRNFQACLRFLSVPVQHNIYYYNSGYLN